MTMKHKTDVVAAGTLALESPPEQATGLLKIIPADSGTAASGEMYVCAFLSGCLEPQNAEGTAWCTRAPWASRSPWRTRYHSV